MAMAGLDSTPEDFVVTKTLNGAKFLKALKRILLDTFGQAEVSQIKGDLADALEINEEDIPNVEVSIVAKVGKQTTTVSGLEAEETDEDEE